MNIYHKKILDNCMMWWIKKKINKILGCFKIYLILNVFFHPRNLIHECVVARVSVCVCVCVQCSQT